MEIESTSSMFMKNGFEGFTSLNEKLLKCYQHKAYLWLRMFTIFAFVFLFRFNYEK